MNGRFRIVLWVYFSIILPAFAEEIPFVRPFKPVDYGGENQNWSVVQSKEGWIYTANNGGLMEFDGSRWSHFELPAKQTVRAVAAGEEGEIYCGGFAEFGFFRNENGIFHYNSLSRGVQASHLLKEEIWNIAVEGEAVFFQSFSTIYKYRDGRVRVLEPPGAIMFLQNVGERLLVQVIGRGLYELLSDDTFQLLPGTEGLSAMIVQFILPGNGGEILIGTANHGVFIWQNGQMKAWQHPLNKAFKTSQLNKGICLRGGGWAFGTILDGIYLLDDGYRLKHHINRGNGLQNNTVLSLFQDRDDNLWVGLDKGIDYVVLNSPLTFYKDQNGKTGATYTAAMYGGQLYIGTNQGLFFNNAAGEFIPVEGIKGQVWQLEEFEGVLLCGHNNGTSTVSGAYSKPVSEITGGWHTIRVPGRSDLLIQGTYNGLATFEKSGGLWRLKGKVDGFEGPVKTAAFDSEGYLWCADPNKGLYRLKLSSRYDQIESIKQFGSADGLAGEYKLSLEYVSGELFVNSDFAPQKILVEAGRVKLIPPAADIPYKILAGFNGDFFHIEEQGVGWYKDGKVRKLPLKLIRGYEKIARLADGRYLFCLEDGFALCYNNFAGYLAKKGEVHPVIRQVSGPEQFFLREKGVSMLKIPFAENTVRFVFASPEYTNSVRHSWKLEGYSTDWSEYEYLSEKEFGGLKPGRYTFRVKNELQPYETTLDFEVLPPWYRSLPAHIFYVCAFFLFALGVEKFNRRRLERQRRELEEKNRIALEEQIKSAEREKLVLEVETQSRELSNAALNLIRKNEMLLRLKDELSSLSIDGNSTRKIIRLIDGHLDGDHDWDLFEASFNRVHDNFFKRLMASYPDLTPGDLRLAAYLKMNLSSKEIAPLLNISLRGIENKRYRLRKKMGLAEDDNLTEFIMAF